MQWLGIRTPVWDEVAFTANSPPGYNCGLATDSHSIHLSDDHWAMLTDLAARTGKAPDVVVAEAIQTLRSTSRAQDTNGTKSETVYDALTRLGLIGCIQGGPDDVSTNPKYFEGFGQSDH